MKLVIIESPLGTTIYGRRATPEEMAENVRYAHACMRDSFDRGDEAPFGSHILYPLVLDDAHPLERKAGIDAGLAWGLAAALVARGKIEADPAIAALMPDALAAIYIDRGITDGMKQGLERHRANGLPIEMRRLGGEWSRL